MKNWKHVNFQNKKNNRKKEAQSNGLNQIEIERNSYFKLSSNHCCSLTKIRSLKKKKKSEQKFVNKKISIFSNREKIIKMTDI